MNSITTCFVTTSLLPLNERTDFQRRKNMKFFVSVLLITCILTSCSSIFLEDSEALSEKESVWLDNNHSSMVPELPKVTITVTPILNKTDKR